jgi:hypothetical protein
MKNSFIDSDGIERLGTVKYPANSGFYFVIFYDGRTSIEPYTVAFGWNNFQADAVILSSFYKTFKQYEESAPNELRNIN